MELIIHRVNTLTKLATISTEFGCEIDLRSNKGQLILHHEPYETGIHFVDFLEKYHHGLLVLNVKEAGIEQDILKAVNDAGVARYFLLDVEFPYLYRASKEGIRAIAVRFSEEEPIQLLQNFQNRVDWAWIDTLTKFPVTKTDIPILQSFESCLVCPERWGRPHEIPLVRKQILDVGFKPAAVMTSQEHVKDWLRSL
ncbi:MAG: hypothetical protein RIR48_2392 [Bacteroidota bacterium]|jgi:hypothetical protein